MTDEKWRYQVTLQPGVPIGPRRYVRVVVVDGPEPWEAIKKAMDEIGPDNHLWQSDDALICVERVA